VIRVVLADDQALVRAGFRMLLENEDGFQVVGEAADGAEAVQLAVAERPDIVVMDVRMPGMDGITATRRLLTTADWTVHVIVLTTFDLDEYVFDAMRHGASGFLLKTSPPRQLPAAVRDVQLGETMLSSVVTRRLIERFAAQPPAVTGTPPAFTDLTARELEGPAPPGPRTVQHRDRRRPRDRRIDRQDPRRTHPEQARPSRPHPSRGRRLPTRPRHRHTYLRRLTCRVAVASQPGTRRATWARSSLAICRGPHLTAGLRQRPRSVPSSAPPTRRQVRQPWPVSFASCPCLTGTRRESICMTPRDRSAITPMCGSSSRVRMLSLVDGLRRETSSMCAGR
jgi:DNA-binding NarL/FixJ family response regulator